MESTETPFTAEPLLFGEDDYAVMQGKKHVLYKALLRVAQAQGLISLEATFLTHTADCCTAKAVATFKDGRVYTECGDATPDNVGSFVRPHFMRMALTRAKGRALRDALGVGEATFEELGGNEHQQEAKPAVPAMSPRQSDARGGPLPFTASRLESATSRQGKTYWKVFGHDMPKQFAQHGMLLRFDVADACDVSFEPPTDIDGWIVHWVEEEFNGKPSPRIVKLVAPMGISEADDDTDVPF